MNKSELITAMSKRSGLTKSDCSKVLTAFVGVVASELSKKGDVRLTNFGKFLVRHRAARKGRNPQTGAPLTISARNTPAFKAGRALKKAVNE